MLSHIETVTICCWILQLEEAMFLINPVCTGDPGDLGLQKVLDPVVILTDPEAAVRYDVTHGFLVRRVRTHYGLRVLMSLSLANFLFAVADLLQLTTWWKTVGLQTFPTNTEHIIGPVQLRFQDPLTISFVNNEMYTCSITCKLTAPLQPGRHHRLAAASDFYALIPFLGECRRTGRKIYASKEYIPILIYLFRLLPFEPHFAKREDRHGADADSVKGTGPSFDLQQMLLNKQLTEYSKDQPCRADAIYLSHGGTDAIHSTCLIEWLRDSRRLDPVPLVIQPSTPVWEPTFPIVPELFLNRPDAPFCPKLVGAGPPLLLHLEQEHSESTEEFTL
ncbi:hypothetical protein GMRT_10734 [Giardia muris]|uniref:Uncharacterized protein n=1 Tax=Giardia muris TaxID=5742 RepID=A0A4Z1T4T2_GIAMU|nr:hypothetical protein GMRT_10734 [Giardia muris]|eukprot:TNJ30678.1 hypothetical protein GMRT_10734 [Giardia muris]